MLIVTHTGTASPDHSGSDAGERGQNESDILGRRASLDKPAREGRSRGQQPCDAHQVHAPAFHSTIGGNADARANLEATPSETPPAQPFGSDADASGHTAQVTHGVGAAGELSAGQCGSDHHLHPAGSASGHTIAENQTANAAGEP